MQDFKAFRLIAECNRKESVVLVRLKRLNTQTGGKPERVKAEDNATKATLQWKAEEKAASRKTRKKERYERL